MANEPGIDHLLNFQGKGKGFYGEQAVEASLFESENGIDVAISFDTTGSMWPVFQLVKERIQETCTLLLEDIPNLRIAIMAHGDYGEDSTGGRNTLRILDFTRNMRTIQTFVDSARMTNGEDWEECYEYVLNRAQKLSWGREHNKTLIMIGDAVPHPPSVTSDQIWWRDEVEALYRFHGVKIYAVQAYESWGAKPFWIELARRSGGIHLTLDKFSIINDMFRAMCYLQSSPELLMKYRDLVIREKRMTGSLLKVFDKATFTKPPPPLKTWYPMAWWNLKMDRPGLLQFVWDSYRKRYLHYVPRAGQKIPSNWIERGRFEAADAEVNKEAALPTASTRVGSAILEAPSAYVIKKFNEQNAAKKEDEKKKENEQYVLKKVGNGIFELVKGDASLAPPVAKAAATNEDEDDLGIPLKKEMGPPPEKHHRSKDPSLKVEAPILERFAIARLQRDLKELIKNPMYNVSCLPLETDFMEWHGNLSGPSGTPYDGIIFHFRVNFPNNYPNSPPGVSLYTQVYHPNVYGTWLCLDMLELGSWGNTAEKDQLFTGWSTAYTVSSILAQLQSFLFQGAWTDARYIEESRKKSKIFSCMKCGHHTDNGKNVFPPFPKIVGHAFPKTMPLLPVNKKKTKAPPLPPPKSVEELKQLISEKVDVDAKVLSDGDAIAIDDLVLGTVESVKPELGAFVKISDSRTGLLHNSNMAPGKIAKGQKIPVYVDSVDTQRGRLGLSTIADTLTRVWRRQTKIFYSELKEEDCRIGEIVDQRDLGVLVNIGVFRKDEFKRTVNVKAFLHRSEMGWSEGNVGSLLKVWVKKLDPETFGIKLSTMDAGQRTGFITRLEQAILQNYNDPAKPKPPVEDRSYDSLAFSHLSWMPVEILFMMMDYLTPIDVMRWGTTCKYLRRLCEDGHPYLFERDEVICFHSKLPFTEDVLGVGVNPERKINGKLAYITCTFDLLSATAFDQEKVRKASYKEKFSHWMPLCITADHAKRSMPLIQRSLSLICTGKPDQFEPDQILEVIPKLMNTFVVSAMSDKLYASMMALDGYIAFHHLFLTLLDEYPELRVKIDAEIASFCESQKTRHKKRIAALGDFIPLLTVTETYQWKDVAVPYLLEMFDRNVLWTLKAHPQYREPSPVEDWVRRLGETFSTTKVSNRLLMFHVYFLRHIARPDGMTLDQIKAVLDSRYGRPTPIMRERLLRECKRIQKVTQWETFFWKINLTPPGEATLIHWLHESLRNSSRRKYHNPDDFTPAAIALRKKLESQAELELSPKVAVNTKAQEKKKRVTVGRDDDDKYYDKLHSVNRSGYY